MCIDTIDRNSALDPSDSLLFNYQNSVFAGTEFCSYWDLERRTIVLMDLIQLLPCELLDFYIL